MPYFPHTSPPPPVVLSSRKRNANCHGTIVLSPGRVNPGSCSNASHTFYQSSPNPHHFGQSPPTHSPDTDLEKKNNTTVKSDNQQEYSHSVKDKNLCMILFFSLDCFPWRMLQAHGCKHYEDARTTQWSSNINTYWQQRPAPCGVCKSWPVQKDSWK